MYVSRPFTLSEGSRRNSSPPPEHVVYTESLTRISYLHRSAPLYLERGTRSTRGRLGLRACSIMVACAHARMIRPRRALHTRLTVKAGAASARGWQFRLNVY